MDDDADVFRAISERSKWNGHPLIRTSSHLDWMAITALKSKGRNNKARTFPLSDRSQKVHCMRLEAFQIEPFVPGLPLFCDAKLSKYWGGPSVATPVQSRQSLHEGADTETTPCGAAALKGRC